MVDLHTHSTASDGELDPGELVRLAKRKGVTALALTDHDTIAGLDAAATAAGEEGMRFVPGVEIEIDFGPGEFHLLGLDLRSPSEAFVAAVATLGKSRETRNSRIVELLRGAGLDLSYGELELLAGGGAIGRPHIAELLLRKRLVRTKQDAFDRYIGKGRPYYVRKDCLELGEAVSLIQQSGGLAFVAHPMSLFVSWTRLRSFAAEWKDMGIDGLETWHPTTRVIDCERLEALAKATGLRMSAGSDYHGKGRPDRTLGRTAGDRPIADSFIAAIERV